MIKSTKEEATHDEVMKGEERKKAGGEGRKKGRRKNRKERGRQSTMGGKGES
jgi:hypothetical protein